jgi:integrase
VKVCPADVHLGPDARLDLLETKGGKPYSVPLERAGVVAAGHLLDRLRRGGSSEASEDASVGERPPYLIGVGAERFRQWVHAAEQEAGLGRVWPHLLRHAASTRVARSSDPETWRRFMNHADLSQWARYVAGTDERVRAAVPTP